MAIVLVDERSNLVEALNRYYHRDKGNALYGDAVKWTRYSGGSPVLTLRHATPGSLDLAILHSGTAADATATAANSVLFVNDDALSLGMGKPLRLYNPGGSNFGNLYHSNTNDVLKTDDGLQVAVALNVGAAISAGDVGDIYAAGGISAGTYTNPATGQIIATVGVGVGLAPSVALHVSKSYSADWVAIIEQLASAAGSKGLQVKSANTSAADQAFLVETSGVPRFYVLSNGQTAASSATNPVIAANQTGAAAIHGVYAINRAAVLMGSLGLDAADGLAVINSAGAVVAVNPAASAFFLPTVPSVYATASGTTVGTGSSTTPINFDASVYDTDSMYDAVNDRIKFTRAGKYNISATVEYPGNTAGALRWSRMYHNGAGGTVIAQETDSAAAGAIGGSAIYHNLATDYVVAANDFIEIIPFQDTGGDQSITGKISAHFVSR